MPIPARSPERPLNSELERLLYQTKVVRQEAEGLVWGLTDAQFNWSPGPGQWSMAQCFDHLNVTNKNMLDSIDAALKAGRAEGKRSDGPFAYGFLSRWFLRTLEPPVKRRFKAPPPFQPAAQKNLADVIPTWESLHTRLADMYYDAHGLDLGKIKVASPASSIIRYPVGVAFWVICTHDRRHLWQARQIRNNPAFPQA